jgi:predicted transposase YdaD
MLGLSELRQTRVYQEALEEGEQTGEIRLIFRQLARRVGTIPAILETQVQALDLPGLEALGEALLDFSDVKDLIEWLRKNS